MSEKMNDHLTIVVKGDLVGHEFHGNQYTIGQGAAAAPNSAGASSGQPANTLSPAHVAVLQLAQEKLQASDLHDAEKHLYMNDLAVTVGRMNDHCALLVSKSVVDYRFFKSTVALSESLAKEDPELKALLLRTRT